MYYNPRKRRYYSNQKLSTAFPRDWGRKNPRCQSLWQEMYGKKKILLWMLPSYFPRWSVKSAWILPTFTENLENVYSVILTQDRLRYLAKSDKGGTCIRRKALYLMLQVWSQAPKPMRKKEQRIHQSNLMGPTYIPPGSPFVPSSCWVRDCSQWSIIENTHHFYPVWC